MAGGDRQGQQGRGASGASSDLTQTQRNQVEALRAQTEELAEALRGAQADRAAQTRRLAQALGDDEAVAQTYAERLGDVRGHASRSLTGCWAISPISGATPSASPTSCSARSSICSVNAPKAAS